jgi:hypothetical protein
MLLDEAISPIRFIYAYWIFVHYFCIELCSSGLGFNSGTPGISERWNLSIFQQHGLSQASGACAIYSGRSDCFLIHIAVDLVFRLAQVPAYPATSGNLPLREV